MDQTRTLFLENTYLFATPCLVQGVGTDEQGNYIVVDQSIFYPQGGGQPSDTGYVSVAGEYFKILGAKYTEMGIRHYLEAAVPEQVINQKIAMYIHQDTRRMNAAYHTAGHWLSQVVVENMQLPLIPIKGHHFPGEAYIEFEGDANCINADTINEMRMVMFADLQANLKMEARLAQVGTDIFKSASLPKNFNPPANKPLRLTRLESYRWLPCGGTHVETLREIKSVMPVEFYTKNSKVRLKYRCDVWEKVVV